MPQQQPQQQEPSAHCPFLNRSDQRCSEFFNLDHLQHAFKFCFDRYTTCPVYTEQLAERQTRRQGVMVGHATSPVYVEITVGARRCGAGRGRVVVSGGAGTVDASAIAAASGAARAARYEQPQSAAA